MRITVRSDTAQLTFVEAMNRLGEIGLYKTRALLAADSADIPVLPSLLLLSRDLSVLQAFIDDSQLPVMLRMDYSQLPKNKPLGGIPLSNSHAIGMAVRQLWGMNMYPLFQQHVSRFTDRYSLGVSIDRDSTTVNIEILGEGFDAGDLRLGWASPQESMRVEIVGGRILQHFVVDDESYHAARKARLERIGKWRSYVRLVNEGEPLAPSLDSLPTEVEGGDIHIVPESYTPISRNLLQDILQHVRNLNHSVLTCLPLSQKSVASFSYTNSLGWVFWDIYGSWYHR